jgi:hypothetical protein
VYRLSSPGRVNVVEPSSGMLPPSGSRTANKNAMRSMCDPRATNARTSADARSSHCASSVTHNKPPSLATSDNRVRMARPTKKRSGAGPSTDPNADANACCCGAGNP